MGPTSPFLNQWINQGLSRSSLLKIPLPMNNSSSKIPPPFNLKGPKPFKRQFPKFPLGKFRWKFLGFFPNKKFFLKEKWFQPFLSLS